MNMNTMIMSLGCVVEATSGDMSTRFQHHPLHMAVVNDDLDALEEAVAQCDDINIETDGVSPLSLAVALGRVDVARRLIQLGADVNAPYQLTPLLVAARFGTPAMVETVLMSNRVNLAAADMLGCNAASLAAENRNDGVMQLIIAAGVDWAKEKTTALLKECRWRGDLEKYDECYLADWPKTPWSCAVMNHNLDALLTMCDLLDRDSTLMPRELLPIVVSVQHRSLRSVWWAKCLVAKAKFDPWEFGKLPLRVQHWLFSCGAIHPDGLKADSIQNATRQFGFLKARAFEVCVGLQALNLSALETCEILIKMFDPYESLVPLHRVWRVVAAVKHLRPRRFRALPEAKQTSPLPIDPELLSRIPDCRAIDFSPKNEWFYERRINRYNDDDSNSQVSERDESVDGSEEIVSEMLNKLLDQSELF
jgi:hypothetical protein